MRKYATSYLIHLLPYHGKRRGHLYLYVPLAWLTSSFFINGKAIQFKVVIDSPLESAVAPTLASYGLEVSECYFLSRPTSKPLRTNCPFTEVLAIEVNLGLKGGGK